VARLRDFLPFKAFWSALGLT